MHVLDELDARGFLKQSTGLDALREHLDAGPVTFYVGLDPTADSLHVGHSVPLMAAGILQRAGHRVIVIIGGGTAMIGDPSGKTEMREMIDREAIARNVAGIRKQVEGLLDIDGERGLIVDNGDWILGLGYIDFLRTIGRHFSVNRMLSSEAYKIRLEKGLSFIEFNYQLLQAYDFLVLHQRYGCTLQIGGDDQWGNILAGNDLIRRIEGHEAQAHAITFPLVTTASGAKMGKTAAGAVWLDPQRTSPFDYFQYWINLQDADVGPMLRRFTTLDLDRIAELEALEGQAINDAKRELAWHATARIHGKEEADRALEAARAMVSGEATDDLPTHSVAAGEKLVVALADAGLCKSRGEARRLVQGGAVRIGGDKVSDVDRELGAEELAGEGVVVRVGKKRAARIVAG